MMVPEGSLAQKAYEHILHQLMTQGLGAGEWVDRRTVAAELRISLAPVSEAIRQLETEGFLECIPRRGTQVRVPRLEELRGQLLLREALEAQAARLYCGTPLRAHREALEPLLSELDESSRSLAAKRNDLTLHRALVELAGCPVLTLHFEQVMRMSLFLAVDRFTALLPEVESDSHRSLIDDLCIATPEEADARVRRHIRLGKEVLFERDWRSRL